MDGGRGVDEDAIGVGEVELSLLFNIDKYEFFIDSKSERYCCGGAETGAGAGLVVGGFVLGGGGKIEGIP
jgi:hypothetical protein